MRFEKTIGVMNKIDSSISKLEQLSVAMAGNLIATEGGQAERVLDLPRFEVFNCSYKKDAIVEIHNHKEDEIFVILTGSATITLDDGEFTLTPGIRSLEVPAGRDHTIKFHEDTEFIVLGVPPLQEFR